MRKRLTNSYLKTAKCDAGKSWVEVRDTEVRAFGLRVYSTGAKNYFIHPMVNGQRFFQERSIHDFPGGIEDARAWAREVRRRIRAGEPIEDIREKMEGGVRTEDFFEEFLTKYSEIHKKSSATDRRYVEKYILPAFRGRAVEGLTPRDVQALRDKITSNGQEKPVTFNRVRSLLRKAWKWGQKFEYIDPALPDPAEFVDKFKERSRTRHLSDEEFVRLMDAIETEGPELYLAVELALATGLRKTETLSLEWSQVDLAEGRIEVSNTKNGEVHTTTFSKRLGQLLSDRKSVSVSKFIFPGRFDTEPRKDFKLPWKRVRELAGIEDVHWHDLRRTLGTRLHQAGVDLYTIAQTLNHKNLKSTEVYARSSAASIRKPLDSEDRRRQDIISKSRGTK